MPDNTETCESCKKVIPEGEVYTARTLCREVFRGGITDAFHCEYTEVLCSDCSSFRGCGEEPVPPRTPESGGLGLRRAKRGQVADILHKSAIELMKGDEGLLLAVAVVTVGKEGAMINPGPLTAIYVSEEDVPEDLFVGLQTLLSDAKALDTGTQ